MRGRVLVIAGSDSGGGAGIQADIKAITAMNAFAATAITAVTAQNTRGVQGVVGLPADFIRLQIASVLDDLGADALKIGMLGEAEAVDAVADELEARPRLPLVLDPVMTAKGGASLLAGGAASVLVRRLLPMATLLTPNLPEAEALTGMSISDVPAMIGAAEALRRQGAAAVLLKGGHMPSATVTDVLVTAEGSQTFGGPRIDTRHTHGTGCTLASAIAAGLAQGMALGPAVRRARAYLQAAIAAAPGFGAGHGPLNHAVTVDPARFG
jgi:hydroxymethylpyrimidine/phosphomethylpyrimidine kinase